MKVEEALDETAFIVTFSLLTVFAIHHFLNSTLWLIFFQITDNMVCAGHGGATSVSGCHGDSGGPFVCRTGANGNWELHGAVSWGSGRCDATQGYTVFARVAKFRSWIDQQLARE